MMGGRIDPLLGRPDTDFGRGFYTTTLLRQALDWAEIKRGKAPAKSKRSRDFMAVVLWFDLPRNRLAELQSLAFGRGDYDAEEYWSFVQHCRSSVPARSTSTAVIKDHQRDPSGAETCYDMVSGPVSAFWQQRAAIMTADQFSFHTVHGVSVLNDLLVHGTAGHDYGTIRP
jgi:hypothetical protein